MLAWDFQQPDKDFWIGQDPDWLAVLVEIGNARGEPSTTPTGPSVREQLGLPPEPPEAKIKSPAVKARVLAMLEAKQAAAKLAGG